MHLEERQGRGRDGGCNGETVKAVMVAGGSGYTCAQKGSQVPRGWTSPYTTFSSFLSASNVPNIRSQIMSTPATMSDIQHVCVCVVVLEAIP